MLKIHQLFLRSFIAIFLGILTCIVIASYFWLKNIYIKEVEKNLTQNIETLSIALLSLDNLDNQVELIKQKTNLRVTIIDENGRVIAESDKDKNTMDNHLNREEILNIDESGFGKAVRKSGTINKDMLNIVKKANINGEVIYIRMGDYLTFLETRFFELTIQISVIFAIFFLIGLIIIYFISKKLQVQTNNILYFLIKLSKKDGFSKSNLELLDFKYSYEFDKIAKFLKKVAQKLSKKEKLKAKYTSNLKLANIQKDEIISAISHEFKNPVAIISGYSETILNDKDISSDIRDSFIRKIHNSANKISLLIDRLRLSIKLEQNTQDNFFKRCSLSKICVEVIDNLKQKYKDREILFTGEVVELKADEALLYIAIENLVENALKYSQDKIDIVLTKDSLSISDNGIGIAQEDLEKIKQKFYRVSKNSWNNSLGLGLFIVQKIIKLHSYKLEIKSDYNVGSTFTIKFRKNQE